ncbi:MAG TPA: carboxypeptidase regulatory-like domain-containing protein [Candidatus Rubrimentiphilum sp.]|nr:carboxypeptidase regulatory-like domain-containing protein [Candidatus Rubrimentiphilum sp.]
MTRARLFGALFAIVALAACNDSSLPPGGTYNAMSGVVLDAATNQPVSGATVTVDTVLTATTDAQGKFSFAQVPVGDVDVVVTANGYKQYTAPARLDPNKPLALTIALSKPMP